MQIQLARYSAYLRPAEIISEAAMFPADKAVVLVGDDATERAVRQQRLSDFLWMIHSNSKKLAL